MTKEHHLALYRKYRPQNFSDVSGQEQIVSLLTSTIKQKKISHAYLFCGSRGTGKTTVARIVARDLDCNDEDIIEIDAASNRGIDEIRELREAVRTAPFSSPYKVYIIDEAHMLTKEAANALLKTLEEPPSHVVFILATTDPQKLPRTIASRCQIITFKEPDIETLAKRLSFIAESEGFKIEKDIAELIAQHGRGSYRDAIGILEQILTQSDKKVSKEFVESYLGSVDSDVTFSLVEALCEKDGSKITKIILNQEKENKNTLALHDNIINFFRNGLLARVGEQKLIQNQTEENILKIVKIANEFPLTVSSKNLLYLLSKYELVKDGGQNSSTSLLAVMLSMIEN